MGIGVKSVARNGVTIQIMINNMIMMKAMITKTIVLAMIVVAIAMIKGIARRTTNKMMNNVTEVGSLPYNYAVSAAISPNGKEIVVKTYDAIYAYSRASGETILQTLSKKPVSLPYQQEPQGEAVVFENNNSGYYTLSEKALASSVKLYFYKRVK